MSTPHLPGHAATGTQAVNPAAAPAATSSASPGTTARTIQRRQWLLLTAIAGAVLGVTALSVVMTSPSGPRTSTAKPKPVPIMAPGAQVDPRDAWRGQADAQLKSIEQQSKSLAQRNTELEARSQAMLERLQRLESGQDAARDDPGLTPLPPPAVSAPAARPDFGPASRGNGALSPGGSALGSGSRAGSAVAGARPANVPPPVRADQLRGPGGTGSTTAGSTSLGLNGFDGQPGSGGIVSINLVAPTPTDPQAASNGSRPKPAGQGQGQTPSGTDRQDSRAAGAASVEGSSRSSASTPSTATSNGRGPTVHDLGSYLPSGTFTRALLLGGLDAPTGGQAQRDPQPVLLRLVDHAILPNRMRSRVKECFVVGAGYGDVSAERAYVRTESLSCVTHQQQVLDLPIRGYVAGEDGKAGLRGRLVSKQGQILANALLAGVASGIGSAFQQNATTVAVSPLGATSSVDAGKQFEAGLGTGVGKAMDRLAQYYITLAEKVFPVIEVDAGRTVDVVLTQGVALPVTLGAVPGAANPQSSLDGMSGSVSGHESRVGESYPSEATTAALPRLAERQRQLQRLDRSLDASR